MPDQNVQKYKTNLLRVITAQDFIKKSIRTPLDYKDFRSKILYDLTEIIQSLIFICNKRGHKNIDIKTVMSLYRSAYESVVNIIYFTIDCVDDREFDFRFLVSKIHDCEFRISFFRNFPEDQYDVNYFLDLKSDLCKKLENFSAFYSLPVGKKREITNGKISKLRSHDELLSKLTVNVDEYRIMYSVSSSFLHSFPFSFNSKHSALSGIEERNLMWASIALEHLANLLMAFWLKMTGKE